MKFSIVVFGAPYAGESADSALNFTRAVLASGHSIYRLFFYQDGVHNASTLSAPPQDERDIPLAWRELIETHGLDAVVCIASALKRGVLDEGEARRYEKPAANLAPGFGIGGLGQWVDALIESDRVVSFAP